MLQRLSEIADFQLANYNHIFVALLKQTSLTRWYQPPLTWIRFVLNVCKVRALISKISTLDLRHFGRKTRLVICFNKALQYLVMISEVEDVEKFKICLEYWNSFSKVRYNMRSRMTKPEEVLVVENENGEVVKEFMKDTNSINLNQNMRETLV